uniref:Uncharacterized protein n=1 Tax=Mesocestoides corti TaxID=53468 RepID=A0A5K3EYI7_MESCO
MRRSHAPSQVSCPTTKASLYDELQVKRSRPTTQIAKSDGYLPTSFVSSYRKPLNEHNQQNGMSCERGAHVSLII